MNRTAQGFAATERELNKERAAALGRIGRRLEGLLVRLGELRVQWDTAAPATRAAIARAYADCHAEARRYRWYLEVQREAVGLRYHRDLDREYPIPPALEV